MRTRDSLSCSISTHGNWIRTCRAPPCPGTITFGTTWASGGKRPSFPVSFKSSNSALSAKFSGLDDRGRLMRMHLIEKGVAIAWLNHVGRRL